MIHKGSKLLQKDISIKHNIDNFLPYGLSLFVGRPKIGKSTFLINFALDCISSNIICEYFNNKSKKKVLFITYEDTERKIRDIILKLKYTELTNFYYSTDFPIEEKGLQEIQEHTDFDIIIIDTMYKFFPALKQCYSNAYNTLNQLHNITKGKDISIILTHHITKHYDDSYDIFNTILGSQGIRGLVDTTYFLDDSSIEIEGREIEHRKYKVKRNGYKFSIHDYSKHNGKIDKQYIDFIYSKNYPVSLREIYENFPDKNKNTIRNRLFRMVQDGRLSKPYTATYEMGPYYDKHYDY